MELSVSTCVELRVTAITVQCHVTLNSALLQSVLLLTDVALSDSLKVDNLDLAERLFESVCDLIVDILDNSHSVLFPIGLNLRSSRTAFALLSLEFLFLLG